MQQRLTILFLLISIQLFSIDCFSQSHYISSFGAKGDGITNNSRIIQNAIDSLHHLGGGQLIFKEGTYLSGSIELKSGVHLVLEANSKILGSSHPDDYHALDRWPALILANDAKNIGISGSGIIDGDGAELALRIDSLFYEGQIDSSDYNFLDKRPKASIRPQLIELVNCKDISIKGIRLEQAASWVQSYFRCERLVIDSIHVESDTYWNNDGIDIIDCKNVRITNSYFNSSDDGICLKSYNLGYKGPQNNRVMCDSIYVANCTIRSSASAFKIGTSSYWGFKNILVENIQVFDTYRSAIALESVHNGAIENVRIRNVVARNTGNALFVRLGGIPTSDRKGYFKNVIIENIDVEIAKDIPDKDYEIRGPSLPYFHNIFPSSITGVKDNHLSGLNLKNIKIQFPGGGNKAYANLPLDGLDRIPEYPTKYPEFSMFGELPAWGFYIRNAEGLELDHVMLELKETDYRPAVVLDNTEDLKLLIAVFGDDKKTQIYKKGVGTIQKKD